MRSSKYRPATTNAPRNRPSSMNPRLRERRRRRRSETELATIRRAVEKELTALDSSERRPPSPQVTAAVDSALQRIAQDVKVKADK
jgi:hypothetical protein